MRDTRRTELVKQLLETACRSLQWDANPTVGARDRLAAVLAAQRLVVETDTVCLRATLGEPDGLTIAVQLYAPWTRLAEAELYDALAEERSALAELVLLDWARVRAACAAGAERSEQTSWDAASCASNDADGAEYS